MTVQRNFVRYHESIAAELQLTKDRIRDLLGSRHWPTDGEHKEAILRKALRSYLPETVRVGKGFVCYEIDSSHQIDVLITSCDKPTLFKDGELALVTPDAVRAIIEVKTRVDPRGLRRALEKLADDAEQIRSNNSCGCEVGLFIYENSNMRTDEALAVLKEVADKSVKRVINLVTLGKDQFVRFWENGFLNVSGVTNGPVWHGYHLSNLAQAYFVSNIVWAITGYSENDMQFAWFPIQGTKERFREWNIPLMGDAGPARFHN